MSELDNGFAFLRQKLTADPTLAARVGARVYEDQAPDGTAPSYPMIIIEMGEPEDLTGVNDQRCSVSTETLVFVVGLGADTGLAALADRIDALLHGSSGENVIHCSRTRPFRRSGYVDKVLYRNLGGHYYLEIGA